MSRLFKRTISVTIARMFEGQFFKPLPNAIVIEDLRTKFSIEKNLGKEPNTCDITVSNLSEDSRTHFQRKPLYIRVDAGYDGQLSRLFAGDVRWADSVLDSVTWNTQIQAGDGDRAFRNARANFSFAAGVNTKTILSHLSKSMGLEIPKNMEDAKEMAEKFVSGAVIQGPSQKELTQLLNRHNMSWSVQDGKLQILRNGGALENQALVISQENGLIGVPEFGAPTNPGEPPVLTARMLLHPGMTPGGKIQLQTNKITGLFLANRVIHTGDTDGMDWFTDVEATPL